MKNKTWQILLGFVLFLSAAFFYFWPAKYKYDLAVCAIFKNEASWLKEWIVYHHNILGVQHFYLYNNDSSDDFQAVLAPFIKKGIVELIDWNSEDKSHRYPGDSDNPTIPWHMYQLGAYNECLKKRALGKAKWVAVIDVDEFIVPVNGISSFKRCLRTAEKRRKGSIKFSWRMFGTSNIWDLKPSELLTERLVMRGEDNAHAHKCGKCIHRPEAVNFCHIHDACKLKEGFRFRHVDADEIRIHHYWARTEKFSLEKRGTKAELYNSVADRTMDQYIPRLKKALANWDRVQVSRI